MEIVFFIISFLASIIGAVSGIGGGVIIKPALDLFNLVNVEVATFLAGVAVLCMCAYILCTNLLQRVRYRYTIVVPLAVGAAGGGILGKYLFNLLLNSATNLQTVKLVQSVIFTVLMALSLLYIIFAKKIPVLHIVSRFVCVILGLILGLISSFLGIGGGPLILVVLYFFIGMNTRQAVRSSLFIIVFSQLASVIYQLITKTVPDFDTIHLVLMIAGGIAGGIVGRLIFAHMPSKAISFLLMGAIALIIAMGVYNIAVSV